MTSEIALLNRSAIALAADSAVTVSYWDNGQARIRYFKGANKLFHLSAAHPIGMMIYASADLQGVPWEVLAKAFRDHLGNTSHDKLSEYADGFFNYVSTHGILFPLDTQEKQFKSDVRTVAVRILVDVLSHQDYKSAQNDEDRSKEAKQLLSDVETKIDAAAFVGDAGIIDLDAALAKYTGEIEALLSNDEICRGFSSTIDLNELAKLAIRGLFKQEYTSLSYSGIVFAGFGNNEFFPRLTEYRCFGFILGKLICEEDRSKAVEISQENGSEIVPFAQDEMIKTFMHGVSTPALVELDRAFVDATQLFESELRQNGKIGAQEDLGPLTEKAKDKFSSAAISYFVQTHSSPLRRAIGMLSIGELAELAETLISLESLKERVTRPSDSVSGPIDVAVISKSDGFIWIKRKHYFDAGLNSRYFTRRDLLEGRT